MTHFFFRIEASEKRASLRMWRMLKQSFCRVLELIVEFGGVIMDL